MTEAEWLQGNLPERMLLDLAGERRKGLVKKTDRGLQLFSCACCSQVERLVADERVRRVIQVVERHVDGEASADELQTAGDAVERAWEESRATAGRIYPDYTLWLSAPVPILHLLEAAAFAAGRSTGRIHTGGWYLQAMEVAFKCRLAVGFATVVDEKGQQPGLDAHLRTQRALLFDCLGNPFRPSPPLSPAVLAWNNGMVRKIAAAIYADRDFEQMPILADALFDAGCEDEALLAHCRESELHVRGCWALDWILEKKEPPVSADFGFRAVLAMLQRP